MTPYLKKLLDDHPRTTTHLRLLETGGAQSDEAEEVAIAVRDFACEQRLGDHNLDSVEQLMDLIESDLRSQTTAAGVGDVVGERLAVDQRDALLEVLRCNKAIADIVAANGGDLTGLDQSGAFKRAKEVEDRCNSLGIDTDRWRLAGAPVERSVDEFLSIIRGEEILMPQFLPPGTLDKIRRDLGLSEGGGTS